MTTAVVIIHPTCAELGAVGVLVTCIIGGVTYAGAALALRVRTAKDVQDKLIGKVLRRRPRP